MIARWEVGVAPPSPEESSASSGGSGYMILLRFPLLFMHRQGVSFLDNSFLPLSQHTIRCFPVSIWGIGGVLLGFFPLVPSLSIYTSNNLSDEQEQGTV